MGLLLPSCWFGGEDSCMGLPLLCWWWYARSGDPSSMALGGLLQRWWCERSGELGTDSCMGLALLCW